MEALAAVVTRKIQENSKKVDVRKKRKSPKEEELFRLNPSQV